MTHDICEMVGRSQVQHGPHSNRIYLMKLDRSDLPGIVDRLDAFARENRYTKIFAKVPASAARPFTSQGYEIEATISCFYNGTEDAAFLGKFLDPGRARAENQAELDRVLSLAKSKATDASAACAPPSGFDLASCGPDNAGEMSAVYKEVFPTYPFPIHDPGYLRDTMKSHIDYFGVRRKARLVALSSAEMDHRGANVEMTDFATLPSHRGHGFAVLLLRAMEAAMRERRMITAYTIARAVSPGMNITFAKMGYTFSGTLINNTNISGGIESMNIWHKVI